MSDDGRSKKERGREHLCMGDWQEETVRMKKRKALASFSYNSCCHNKRMRGERSASPQQTIGPDMVVELKPSESTKKQSSKKREHERKKIRRKERDEKELAKN